MEKKKCEICGQFKPLGDFSKSYKNRCKPCVAEAARNERQRFKELENACVEALNGGGAHIAVSDNNTLLYMATAFMQGMLSNPQLCNPLSMNAETVVVLARNAVASAKAFIKIFEKEGND